MVFLSVQVTQAKKFEMKSVSSSALKITDQYNKNLNVDKFLNSHLNLDESFSKDFKNHLRSTKIRKFLKSQLIGDTVFFKDKKIQIKLKPIEIKNNYVILMQINGQSMTLNTKDGFAKNYAQLLAITQPKSTSLWDLVIPRVYAANLAAPKELDEALSSALSWSSWAMSAVSSDGKIEKEKICNLNEKEAASYTPGISPEVMLDEIKYFVEVQNKYAKPLIQNDRGYIASGGTECMGKCEWAKEFESCLTDMAERRNNAISSSGVYGLSCFKRYEDDGIYLSSDLLNQSLQSYDESYDAKVNSITNDIKYKCGAMIHDDEAASCRKNMANRLAELNAVCPPDEKSAAQVSNPKSKARSNRGSR
jgi:hypothetical protein